MKKIVFILISVFCMCCMVACGGEVKEDVSASSSNEVADNSANDQPVVTEAPAAEPEVTPAPAETTPEPTPEPTPDPYPGIDMNSELTGKEWVKTFDGIIDEPKVVVYNDETGRKQIVEPNDKVLITNEADILAVHLPDGYAVTGYGDLMLEDSALGDSYKILYLDFEEMVKQKTWMPILMISYEDAEFMIEFKIQTQE